MNLKSSPINLLIALILLSLSLFIYPHGATAQSSSISVNLVPENPAPYEDTNITLSSYANNLDTVLITWFVDGKTALSGIGKKSFSTKAPAAGSQIVVLATIALPDGQVQERIIVRPAVMTLLWQANDSYVPPFYKGKALPTPDSEVKVVAMPEIKNSSGPVSPTNMTYAWAKDYTNDQGSSGYGKNFFIYTNDYLDDSNNISVTASTIDGQSSSDANVDIGTTQPEIVFYRSDASVGTVWENALSNPHKIQGSEVVVAAPYFISPKEILNPRLIFSWFINDAPVNIPGFRKNVIPLKTQEGVSGTSKLRLDIQSQDKIFETASKEVNIQF